MTGPADARRLHEKIGFLGQIREFDVRQERLNVGGSGGCWHQPPTLTIPQPLDQRGHVMGTPQGTLPHLPVQEGVEFRHFPSAPGYCVGDDGSVWSCLTHGKGKRTWLGPIWKRRHPQPDLQGRLDVSIAVNGKRVHRFVHRLVLEAFVGPCPPGMEACHFPDRDPANCRLSNLRWDTKKANAADRAIHGNDTHGTRNGQAKLTPEAVAGIRRLIQDGVPQREIAKRFVVGKSTIAFIAVGKYWTSVK